MPCDHTHPVTPSLKFLSNFYEHSTLILWDTLYISHGNKIPWHLAVCDTFILLNIMMFSTSRIVSNDSSGFLALATSESSSPLLTLNYGPILFICDHYVDPHQEWTSGCRLPTVLLAACHL